MARWNYDMFSIAAISVASPTDKIHVPYRVGLVVWQLGWVDLDLECSTIMLGNSPNLSQPNPAARPPVELPENDPNIRPFGWPSP